jgi:hypothetical protein
MDPRLTYITPFFFIAFGMALTFGIMKLKAFLKARKNKE